MCQVKLGPRAPSAPQQPQHRRLLGPRPSAGFCRSSNIYVKREDSFEELTAIFPISAAWARPTDTRARAGSLASADVAVAGVQTARDGPVHICFLLCTDILQSARGRANGIGRRSSIEKNDGVRSNPPGQGDMVSGIGLIKWTGQSSTAERISVRSQIAGCAIFKRREPPLQQL